MTRRSLIAGGTLTRPPEQKVYESRTRARARMAAAFATHLSPVAAAPPTITLAVNTSPTAQATPNFYGITAGVVRFFSGYPTQYVNSTRTLTKNGLHAGPDSAYAQDFETDAATVEIFFRNGTASGGNYRVRINGEYVSLTPTNVSTSAGVINRITIAFGSAAVRHIEIESYLLDFLQIVVSQPFEVWYPSRPRPLVTLLYGDSIADGTGADSKFGAWPYSMARELGVQRNVMVNGQGGTGYLNPGPAGGRQVIYDRIAVNIAQGIVPDIVIMAAGTNDGTNNNAAYTTVALEAEVRRCLKLMAAAWPSATVVLMGAFFPSFAAPAADRNAVTASNAAVLAAANELNVFGSVDMSTWITTLNQSRYISGDGIHPTQAGHDYYGGRAAAAIGGLLNAAAA